MNEDQAIQATRERGQAARDGDFDCAGKRRTDGAGDRSDAGQTGGNQDDQHHPDSALYRRAHGARRDPAPSHRRSSALCFLPGREDRSDSILS